MSSWLSMPRYLRKEEVRRLILARRRNDPAAFCDAYQKWHGTDFSSEMQQRLDMARQGNQASFDEIWLLFLNRATNLGDVTDLTVSQQLAIARSANITAHADAREALISYLDGIVDEYREGKLYDERVTASVAHVETLIEIDRDGDIAAAVRYEDEAEEDDTATSSHVWDEWDTLADNIGASAERLWRDVFLETDFTDTSSGKYSGALHDITRASHRLMLLQLEARFYRERSYYNQEGRALISGQSIRKQIGAYVKEYRAIIAQWDKELYKATRVHYFLDRGMESQQFRRLIYQFSELNRQELGWASQASDVEAELRYQLRDEVRHEAWVNGHPFASFGLLILKLTTGYGTRPAYFMRTALVALGVDALLFFLSDLFHPWLDPQGAACVLSQPHIQQWSDVIPLALNYLLHYLYIAATTLTSLGTDTSLVTYCHSWSSQAILIVSAIFGYFMLGLLGALLFSQLTQRN